MEHEKSITDMMREWANTLNETHEVVNEELLDEASGVGIIKVPQYLLNIGYKYVGSVLLSLANKQYLNLKQDPETNKNEIQKLYNFMKQYQSKTGAVVLSDQDLKKYQNGFINLKIDPDQLLSELNPKWANDPRVQEVINKLSLAMHITTKTERDIGGHSHQVSSTRNIVMVKVPTSFINVDTDRIIYIMNYKIGTIEHEYQHTIQQSIIKTISPNDEQLVRKDGYEDLGSSYHASGIEYGPQVKDLINMASNWLENNKDSLIHNKNKDISSAVQYSMQHMVQGTIVNDLKNYKHDDRAKKAMKLIYKNLSDFYENKLHLENDSEFDDTEGDLSDNENDSFAHHDEPTEDDDNPLGKVWHWIKPYANDIQVYGKYEKVTELRFKTRRDDGYAQMSTNPKGIEIAGKGFQYVIKYEDLDFIKEHAGWIGSSLSGNVSAKNEYENSKKPQMSWDSIQSEVQSIISNYEPQGARKVISFYDKDELNRYIVEFKGVRTNIWLTPARHDLFIELSPDADPAFYYDPEKFYLFLNELIEFYYKPDTDLKIFNNVLQNIKSVDMFDFEMSYMDKENSEKSITEEMRNWADIAQEAELEDNIENARNQTLINTGKEPERTEIDEAPVVDDFYAGNRDSADQILKLKTDGIPQDKLTPVKDHGTFSTYKNPKGNVYMAYDKQGKVIGIMEGSVHNNVFKIENTIKNTESTEHGLMINLMMDAVGDGLKILSDTIQSPSAKRMWERLITSGHTVYLVKDKKPYAVANPNNMASYWSDDYKNIIQFLLVK